MVYVTETLIGGFYYYYFYLFFLQKQQFSITPFFFFFLLYLKKKKLHCDSMDEKKSFSFRKLFFTFYLCTGNQFLDFSLLLDAILCVFNAVPCFSSRQLTGRQKQSTANFNLAGRTFYTQQQWEASQCFTFSMYFISYIFQCNIHISSDSLSPHPPLLPIIAGAVDTDLLFLLLLTGY